MKSESFPWEPGDTALCVGRTLNGAGRYPTVGQEYTLRGVDSHMKRLNIRYEDGLQWWYEAADFIIPTSDEALIAKHILSSKKEEPMYTQIGLRNPSHLGTVLKAFETTDITLHLMLNDAESMPDQGSMTDVNIVSVNQAKSEFVARWSWNEDESEHKTFKFKEISGVWVL